MKHQLLGGLGTPLVRLYKILGLGFSKFSRSAFHREGPALAQDEILSRLPPGEEEAERGGKPKKNGGKQESQELLLIFKIII